MQWHVVYSGINQEMLALRGLLAKGFETYCPTGKRVVRHARRESVRIFPVFSRYLFVKFNSQEAGWSEPLRTTDGIIDVLTNDYIPMSIPDWIVEDIKQRELAGDFNIIPPVKIKRPRWSKSFAVLKNLLNTEAEVRV